MARSGPTTLHPPLSFFFTARCAAYVTGVVIVGFLLHPIHHIDPAWFAVIGAVVLCVVTEPMDVEKLVRVSRRRRLRHELCDCRPG